MKPRLLSIIGIAAFALCSCGPPAIEGGFDSGNPAAKIYAIEHAARDHDRSAIPHIVAQLDSDDPAVRSVAIAALKRMTGKTYGYRDYDPAFLRQEAIDRWEQALKADEVFSDSSPNHADVLPASDLSDTPTDHG